jgi:hypothetical protein
MTDDWPPEGFYRITSPRFRPREDHIPSSIFEYGGGGFNNWCVMDCPMRMCDVEKWGAQYKRQWLWASFCIDFKRVKRFISRCEYLGTEIPTHLLGVTILPQQKHLELFA